MKCMQFMSQQYFGSSISLLTAAASAEVQCVPSKVSPSSPVALEADANIFQSVPYFDPLQTMAYLRSSPLSFTACKGGNPTKRRAYRDDSQIMCRVFVIKASVRLIPPAPLSLSPYFQYLGPPRWNYPLSLISFCSCRTKITHHQNFPSVSLSFQITMQYPP